MRRFGATRRIDGGIAPALTASSSNVHLHRAPCLILLDGVDEARKSEEVWNWALALPLPTQILATSRLAVPDTKRFEIVTVTESGTFGIVAKSVQSAGYYLKQVRQHADLNQKVNLDWFDREWPNIYTAAKLAVEQEDYNSLIDFINSTSEYSTLRGLWKEREFLLHEALDGARFLNEKEAEGLILNDLGTIYKNLGDLSHAEVAYKESLEICRELSNARDEAGILNNLGTVYETQNRLKEAEQNYLASRELFRHLDYRQGEAISLDNLGNVFTNQAMWHEAEIAYQEGLLICRSFNDSLGESKALHNLGFAYELQGRLNEAEAAYQDSLKIKREFGDLVGEGQTLENVALLWQTQGELAKALPYARQAVAVLEATQDATELEKARGILSEIEAQLASEAGGDLAAV